MVSVGMGDNYEVNICSGNFKTSQVIQQIAIDWVILSAYPRINQDFVITPYRLIAA